VANFVHSISESTLNLTKLKFETLVEYYTGFMPMLFELLAKFYYLNY